MSTKKPETCPSCGKGEHESCLRVWWIEERSGWIRRQCGCCVGPVECTCGTCEECHVMWPRRVIRRSVGSGRRLERMATPSV